MAYLKPAVMQVPSAVNELITVHIKDPELIGKDFKYFITDTGQQICRKGQFRGLHIQLRISHLKEGQYYFNLQSSEIDTCTFPFEKVNNHAIE